MQKRYDFYIKDILECIRKIEKYTQTINYKEFCSKDLVVDAVTRNLEIIGEAAETKTGDKANV